MFIHQYSAEFEGPAGFRDSLAEIWLSSFDDTREYFDFFYDNNVLAGNSRIFYAEDENTGKITGASYLLGPCSYKLPYNPLEMRSAYYGYGFAVLPEYRGTGVFKAISRAFCAWAMEKGAGIFIYPANMRLMKYYTANGARQNFTTRIIKTAANELGAFFEKFNARDILPECAGEYTEIRNRHFGEYGNILWDENAVKYAIAENLHSGGFCKVLSASGTEHIVMGHMHENGSLSVIKDTTLTPLFLKENGVCVRGTEVFYLASYGIDESYDIHAGLLLD